jgi:hypothetical protein
MSWLEQISSIDMMGIDRAVYALMSGSVRAAPQGFGNDNVHGFWKTRTTGLH